MRHGLDYLAKLYLGYVPIATSELIGEKGKEQKCMSEVPVERLAEYACEDADVTLQIANLIRPEIDAQGTSQVCNDVECPLIPVLVDMEHEGIRLDTEALAIFSKKLADEIESSRNNMPHRLGMAKMHGLGRKTARNFHTAQLQGNNRMLGT